MNFTAKMKIIRTDKPTFYIDRGRYGVPKDRRVRGDKEVAPYMNPLIEKMRRLLKKQKVDFTEESDGDFIIFTAKK